MITMNSSKSICSKMIPAIYSRPQQYAIISILILIMEADGVIDPNEIQFLNKMLLEFNISELDLETISSYDINHCRVILSDMDAENIEYAKSLFVEMAKCDGYADPRELEIIERFTRAS